MRHQLVASGDRITCENGHVIGEAKSAVSYGDPHWHAKFEWTANAPSLETPVSEARCMGCGGRFTKGDDFGWSMRFEDGSWRP